LTTPNHPAIDEDFMQRLHFNNQHYWALILFVVLGALTIAYPRDLDYFWHLRNGQWMVEHGEILRVDPFSYTMIGEPRIAYDWLADVGLYQFWQVFGHIGIAFLTAFLSLLIYITIYYMLPGHIYIRFIVIAPFLLFLSLPALSPRPQIISFLFFTWVLFLTYRYKRGMEAKWLLLMPLMFVLWGNLHGGWSVASIVMIVVTVGEALNNLLNSQSPYVMKWDRLKWYFGACALSAGALLFTPFGLEMILLPFTAFSSLSTWNSEVMEWHPTQINSLRGGTLVLFTLSYAVCVLLPAYRKRQLDWSHLLLGVVMGYMAYRYSRSVVFFALVGAPIIIEQFSIWVNQTEWGKKTHEQEAIGRTPTEVKIKKALFTLMLGVSIGYAIWSLTPQRIGERMRELLPVDAVNIINEEQLPQRLFSHYNWGGYLLWETPDYPVFIDGRTDLYRDFYFEWREIMRGANWEEAFAEWDIKTVLVYPNDPIGRLVKEHPDWETVYTDDISLLLTYKGD
jgi:hypothetical protein